MSRLFALLIILLFASTAAASSTQAPEELKDLYFGAALYDAFQGDWFEAIARLDTELGQFRGLDEPELDTLYSHLDLAEFAVGDLELAYRMHRRAGRAITAVIDGNVADPVRNEAIFRLARIQFQKRQPLAALAAIERLRGEVPSAIRDDVAFLRAQIFMATGRFDEAAGILHDLLGAGSLTGFSAYNLGIALLKDGREAEGRRFLERAGQVEGNGDLTPGIRDKANLVLGSRLLDASAYDEAKQILDRVRLTGPFSNRALLGSGWADAFQGNFDRALVPWSLLAEREVTDPAVQEALLAVPYAYGKLKLYSRSALGYGHALKQFGDEIDKLDRSVASIREGRFLEALVREELKQDSNWVVRLRELPETPETYYLLDLMASHPFQESLKNFLDLEQLRRKLEGWGQDLGAFADLIATRRAYYQPLLPEIDRQFRQLDSQMRLRLEQRDHIERRLQSMLVVPRPDDLATAGERVDRDRLARLRRMADRAGDADAARRIGRLEGVLTWAIRTEYDRRMTDVTTHLARLNEDIERLQAGYASFVRTRQAATQSYQGYEETIRRLRIRIEAARKRVGELIARQGHLLEVMAVDELTRRRERLEVFQVKARFALADSYDRAARSGDAERRGE